MKVVNNHFLDCFHTILAFLVIGCFGLVIVGGNVGFSHSKVTSTQMTTSAKLDYLHSSTLSIQDYPNLQTFLVISYSIKSIFSFNRSYF